MIFKTTRQRLSRITGGVSCFLFYLIQKKKWLKVTECLHLLCLRETRTVSTLSSRDINTFTKVNVSLWPRVSSTFTVQRNMAKIHRRFQNTLSRAPSDSVSVQDAGMMRGPQVQLCACDDVYVYICSCVCVCVCVSPCCLEVEGLSLRLKCLMRQHRRRVYFSASGQKKEAVTKRSEEEDRRF